MEYVSRVLLDINGTSITDFNAVEEKEYELHKPVNLMNKTGHLSTMQRYGVSVDYVIPSEDSEFDFSGVANGRLSIDFLNGRRTTYIGLYVLKIGNTKYEPDKEAVRTIEFSAENRIEE